MAKEAIRNRIVELRNVPAAQLKPHARNWRRHPESQRLALRGLLEEIGIIDVAIAREVDGELILIDGHLRQSELETVPTLILDVSEKEAETILATLDPLAAEAETDTDVLAELLGSIETGSEAVRRLIAGVASRELPNFSLDFLTGQRDLDLIPEPPRKPVTKNGDVWKLGDHLLLCGDACEADSYSKLRDELVEGLGASTAGNQFLLMDLTRTLLVDLAHDLTRTLEMAKAVHPPAIQSQSQ